jgi:pyoverdine/dityrosine biosynthesis protein Dit1/alpha-ketoglutarate-dependent taurine dioxygenase
MIKASKTFDLPPGDDEVATEDRIDQIVVSLLGNLLAKGAVQYNGFKVLKTKVAGFVRDGQPIDLVLPAFPCKSVNTQKCFGRTPDMAEWLAIRTIVTAIRDIEEVYSPGVRFTIFSDYHSFSEYISVNLDEHYQYREHLKKMIAEFNCQESISVKSLCDYQEFNGIDEEGYMARLRDNYGDRKFEQELAQLIASDNDTHGKYLALKSFMEDDQQELLAKMGKSQRRQRLSQIGKGLMVQGKALDAFVLENFPDSIRLSIHEHPMSGSKFTVQLYENAEFKTPWHNCALFDAAAGHFRVGKRVHLIEEAEAAGVALLEVTLDGKSWVFLRLQPSEACPVERMREWRVSLKRSSCGLVIENTGRSPLTLDERQLTHLVREFGTIIFRNFQRFDSPAEIEAWYSKRGRPLQWKFGATHIVKPEHEGDSPRSSVTSEEALPMHWDMVSPPPYMEIDQSIYRYEDYIPREFILYCHKNAAAPGEGLSTLLNSLMVPLMMSGGERRRMRETSLAYRTTMSYFGGIERTYPLIKSCSWTNREVLRWWEMWDEVSHPGSTQYNYTRIAESRAYSDVQALEKKLLDLCGSEACYFTHDFAEGDLMLINNWTMLHGRTAFTGEREVWRIQLQPPSMNSPWAESRNIQGVNAEQAS